MTNYNFHNLISISVSKEVDQGVINSLDIQIGHFKGLKGECEKQIIIKPYNFYTKKKNTILFHLVEGLVGKEYIDHEKKFVLQKTETGFIIYTEDSFLINIFIQLLLIELSYSFIHAAAATNEDGQCLLLPGPGGVGKTAILGKLILEKKYKLLGDDVVAIGKNGECLSLPRHFILKEYHSETYQELFKKLKINSKRKKIIPQISKFLNENAPFAGLIKKYLKQSGYYKQAIKVMPLPKDYVAAVPVSDIFGKDKIIDKAKISQIIFLERYNGKEFIQSKINNKSLVNRLVSIIHHEWASYQKILLSLASLELFDLFDYYKQTYNIIDNSISDKKAIILSIPADAPPLELWDNFKKIIQ